MQLLCPACRTPLPGKSPDRANAVLTCDRCSAEVDVSRAGTAAGRPRFVPEIDRSGDTVSGFVLEERIGAGGMGTVYRARRPGDAAPAAVKFLSPALACEPDVVARFHREVKLLKSLSHPSIVRVIDHGDENGVPWFAMELVDGTDLRGRISKGALSVDECRNVFGRLFEALAHAHEKGIIHRDLKPANVLLAADGAKLADFGIARPDPDAASHATKLTETAAVLGTFPYMSPEQRAGAEVDRRSDLFSAGVLLYESLTGKLPQGAFALPSKVNPALPPRIDLVVAKLLQPDRESRYATAGDAALAFHDAIRPRASMAPVIGFGAVAAVAIALVVPAAMNTSGSRAPLSKKQPALVAPSATPALAVQQAASYGKANPNPQDYDNAYTGNSFVPISLQNDDDTNAALTKSVGLSKSTGKPVAGSKSAAELMKEEELKKLQSKAANSKLDSKAIQPAPVKGDDDDAGTQQALANDPVAEATPTAAPVATSLAINAPSGNRAETNFLKTIETQALQPGAEITPMTATCSPTIVYKDTSIKSKPIAKLSKGHAIDQLKTYRRLAALLGDSLGVGAGLFGMKEPAPPKKTAEAAPRQAAEPQQLQQQNASPEEIWYFVRYSEKGETGWIQSECAGASKSSTPAYGADGSDAQQGSSYSTKRK